MPARCCVSVALLLSLGLAGAAHAQEGRVRFAVSGGTLGVGPELDYRASRQLGVRVQASFLKFDHDFDAGGIDYDGRARLRSGGAMLDYYPFGNGWRISAGARVNGNQAEFSATPDEPVEIGDARFTPAQTGSLLGEFRVRDVAPAVTVGYGGAMARGFTAGIEAGALFQGRPRVKTFRSEGGTLATDPSFRAALAQERVEIENDIDDYKIYPVIQVSLGYRF